MTEAGDNDAVQTETGGNGVMDSRNGVSKEKEVDQHDKEATTDAAVASNATDGGIISRASVYHVSRPTIDPPRTTREVYRDYILRALDSRIFQILGLIVLFLVIADGAFFFFLLMGWHGMCTPRLDCEPRNWWYNWSVQVLTGLFTYMATVSLPWRWANFIHTIGCSGRKNTLGLDLYGLVTKDIWFYIPLGRRLGIIIVLLLNVFTQYANQAMRLVYYSYERQADHGAAVTIFFVASFVFAFVAFIWMTFETIWLRRENPNFFSDDDSNVNMFKEKWQKHCCKCCGGKAVAKGNDDDEQEGEEELSDAVDEEAVDIPTRERRYDYSNPYTNSFAVFFGNRRAELRLLGIG